jgi:hypothetical protein
LIIGLVSRRISREKLSWCINEGLLLFLNKRRSREFTSNFTIGLVHGCPQTIIWNIHLVLKDPVCPEVTTAIIHPVDVDHFLAVFAVDKVAIGILGIDEGLDKGTGIIASCVGRILLSFLD